MTGSGKRPGRDEPFRPVAAERRLDRRVTARTWRRFTADRWAVTGATGAGGLLLAALSAPLLCRVEGQNPYTYHLDSLSDSGAPVGFAGGVGAAHWFGVEPLTGRDLFAIVTYGARTSLLIGAAATVVSVLIGVAVGITAGYLGGWYDQLTGRIIDVLLGFPALVFMIALGAIAPAGFPKPLLVVLIIAIFGWPAMARVVRSQTMTLKQRGFVDAATALGAGPLRVLIRHLLPNLWATVIVYATTSLPGAIGAGAALSFLGVGVPPPTPDLGRSISDASAWIQTDVIYLLLPGGLLFLATASLTLVGDGLRDVLDPRWVAPRRSGRHM